VVKTTSLLPYKNTKKYRESQMLSRLFLKKSRVTLYPVPAVTCAKIAHTAGDGKSYNTKFYNLFAGNALKRN